MIAVAKRALCPALVLGLLAFPGAALAAHANDSYTSARQIDLDANERIDNTGAGPPDAGRRAAHPQRNRPLRRRRLLRVVVGHPDDAHDLVEGDG